jgi:hypothetical protein
MQLRGGVHEVRRREAFRERAVNGRESGAGLVAAALPLPEPGWTRTSGTVSPVLCRINSPTWRRVSRFRARLVWWAGLADEQHDLPHALLRLLPAVPQQADLVVACSRIGMLALPAN